MSKFSELNEILEKAQGVEAPVGTISPNGKFIKVAPGDWRPVGAHLHRVDVDFTHQGVRRKHSVVVEAGSSADAHKTAMDRIKGLESKIGGLTVHGVHVERMKNPKGGEEEKGNKASEAEKKSKPEASKKEPEFSKSIIGTDMPGVFINTSEESTDEQLSRETKWDKIIREAVKHLDYTTLPAEIDLDYGNRMFLSKVDSGLFSGYVKKMKDGGSAGEVILNIQKMTIPSLIQALKSRDCIDPTTAKKDELKNLDHGGEDSPKAEAPEEKDEEPKSVPAQSSISELISALKQNPHQGEFHIHLHKSSALAELEEALGKARGDVGRPTQGMGPTEDQKRFEKPGTQVTMKDCEDFIKEFEDDFLILKWSLKEFKNPGMTFGGRLKSADSLFNKMKSKNTRSLNSITDIIGARIICNTLELQQKALEMAKSLFNIVELEHSVEAPRDGGYRGIHLLVRLASGRIAEIQIKTVRQQVFSSYTYYPIYKQGNWDKTGVKVYTEALSDYLYSLDKGELDIPEKRPKAPDVLREAELKFPWKRAADLDLHLKKALAADNPCKFFIGLGEAILEFEEFEDAKAYGLTLLPKHVCISVAPDKEDYFLTSGNYALEMKTEEPGSDISALVQALSKFHKKVV